MKRDWFSWTYCGIIILISATLLVTGCVSNTYWDWEHQDRSANQQIKDRVECRKIARHEASLYGYYGLYPIFPYYRPYGHWGRHHLHYRDWYDYNRFFYYQDSVERYFNLCMRAKGWTLVKKTRETEEK